MSLKPLDYSRPNPFGETIGRPNRLAWPVNAYRVTLPRASDDGDGLNPFERVILKLLDAVGTMDASALAEETRIPPDLVKGILLRLQDKGYIDAYNAVIKSKRDNRESEKDKVPVFVTALLFRELATGKILPFLHLLDDKNPLRKKECEETFFRSIRWNDAHKKDPPAPRDVIIALRAMKKRSAAFGGDDKMPAVQQITVAQQPELHYLDCPIAIQKSDGEFRIADPFGNGFSLVLESAFTNLLEQSEELAGWLGKWKQALSNPREPKSDKQKKEPFENDTNWQRYPKLVSNLRLLRNTPFRTKLQIHASIEWVLFYTCYHRPFESAIARLRLTAQAEHPALLADAAKDVGLTPTQFGFRPVREGKLIDFQNDKAELETVLAIALLQAEKDDSHPLRRIAPSQPDLISRLFDIKKKRGGKGHGEGKADAPETELPDDSFMRELVHSLLPDIRFADTPVAGSDKDTRADSLLDARTSIQSEFGHRIFNRLGVNLQDRLIHAERFWLSCKDSEDALVFACDLYAAVQAAFKKQLNGGLPPDVSDADIVNLATKKAVDADLCEKLPECLCTVKISAIRQTMLGSAQTLGSCAIAFILMSDDDTLHEIANSRPSFITDISNVIARRGHGNEPLPLSRAKIAELRNAAYSTIRTLMEA